MHAADVVDASLLALRVDGFDAFNVAASEVHSVNGTLDRLLRLDGWSDARVEHVEGRPREPLGFQARVSRDEGLEDTLDWYRRNREHARG